MVTRAAPVSFTLRRYCCLFPVVLGVVLTTVAQVLRWSAAEHQSDSAETMCSKAATTVLDCLSVRDWSAITSESAAAIHLPPDTTRFLADPHLQVSVVEEKEQQALPRKRVSVEITWYAAAD